VQEHGSCTCAWLRSGSDNPQPSWPRVPAAAAAAAAVAAAMAVEAREKGMAAACHNKSTARKGNKGEQPEEAELMTVRVAQRWPELQATAMAVSALCVQPRDGARVSKGRGHPRQRGARAGWEKGMTERSLGGGGGARASAAKSSAVAMAGAQPALVVAL
jgi:hypothetical protein